MDQPAIKSSPNAALSIAITAGALIWACVSWTIYCRYVMGYIPFGLILLPVIVGLGAGFIMRQDRGFFRSQLGTVAAGVTGLGCILGDLAWIKISNPDKSLWQIIGPEASMTLNTLFAIDKVLLYAITAYIAFSLSKSPHGAAQD